MILNLLSLIRLKVITYDDLSDFSDELQNEVKRILETNNIPYCLWFTHLHDNTRMTLIFFYPFFKFPELKDKGIIERKGPDNGGKWKIK